MTWSNPLMAAVVAHDLRAVERVLAKGASREDVTEALSLAAANGADWVAQRLCKEWPHLDDPRWSPLHVAAAHGSDGVVEALLEARATLVDRVDDEGMTPLMVATRGGYVRVVRTLLERDSDLSRGAEHPLFIAARNGDRWSYAELRRRSDARAVRRAESSLAEGIERGARLLEAVRDGDEQAVVAALDRGAWPHTETPDGYPVLTLAARYGHTAIVESLLQAGAHPWRDAESRRMQDHVIRGDRFYWWILEPNSTEEDVRASRIELDQRIFVRRDGVLDSLYPDFDSGPPHRGSNALEVAAAAGYDDVVQQILEHWGHPGHPSPTIMQDAVIAAAGSGRVEVCRRLLKIPRHAHYGDALLGAAEHGWVEVVRMLLDAGIHVDVTDEDGEDTPLSLALLGHHLEVVRLLVERGASIGEHAEAIERLEQRGASRPRPSAGRGNVDQKKRKRRPRLSGLMRAIWSDDRERFDELRVHPEIDIDAYDGNGLTPLIVAAMMRSLYMVDALIEGGADPSKASGGGRKGRQWGVTPLMTLIDPGWPYAPVVVPIIRRLAEAGADLDARDNEGLSAMDRAVRMGGPDVEIYAELLRELGAKPGRSR